MEGLRNGLYPEEKCVLATGLIGILICHFFGRGFSYGVFQEYVMVFAKHLGLYFIASRILLAVGSIWRPATSFAERTRSFVFGDDRTETTTLKIDLVFIRGMLLMYFSLAVYTNLKIRIPFINAYTGDPFFQRLDEWIFGPSLWPWLTQLVRGRPEWSSLLQDIYSHDYIYMVFLVLLLHLRKDVFGMRWIFASVGMLYLSGIFVTLAYPTLGPCFYYWEEWAWLGETSQFTRQVQWTLAQTLVSLVSLAETRPRIEAHAFYGIAAFPSLHCAHMMLLATIAWFRYRIYVPLTLVVLFLTFVATMAFGWHYAVDGIAGIVMAIVVPLFLRKIMLREEPVVDPAVDEPP